MTQVIIGAIITAVLIVPVVLGYIKQPTTDKHNSNKRVIRKTS